MPQCLCARITLGFTQTVALLSFAVLPTLFFSCTEIAEDGSYENVICDETMTEIKVKSPDGLLIRTLDIFFFNDDSLRRLDSHQRIENYSSGTVSAASRNGKKILVAVANSQDEKYEWDEMGSFDVLNERMADLMKESPESPLMSATAEITAGEKSGCSVKLEPLMSKVSISTLCCDFHNRPYKDEKLKDVRIYLTNVNTKCELLRTESFNPISLLNSGRLEVENVEKMICPELVFKHPGIDVDGYVSHPGCDLFCYPNSTSDETIGSPFTRLVIEGEIEGRTYYYPINVNREYFGGGFDKGSEGLSRNKHYSLNITLTRKGSSDPDTAVAPGTVKVRGLVAPWTEEEEKTVVFNFGTGSCLSKSEDPDEQIISDINLFVFNGLDELDEHRFFSKKEVLQIGSGAQCRTRIIRNSAYSYYVCANLGYALKGIRTKKDLLDYKYYMTYPDEYKEGIPMSGKIEGIIIGQSDTVSVPLTRLMSKISLSVNRAALDKDVEFNILSVRIGGCPNSARLFSDSRAESERDVFKVGFMKGQSQTGPLNTRNASGRSGEISLYVLENRQGILNEPIDGLCSFVEIESHYQSDSLTTKPDESLIYRFYLKDKTNNYDVLRNSHYHIAVKPEGSGLNGTEWSVVKTGLAAR
ncbi:MAG: hypothetical protein WCR48_02040 [Bacteroidales bacterium]